MLKITIRLLLALTISITTLATVHNEHSENVSNSRPTNSDIMSDENEDNEGYFLWGCKKIINCFLGKHCTGEGTLDDECGPCGMVFRTVDSPIDNPTTSTCFCCCCPLCTSKEEVNGESTERCCNGVVWSCSSGQDFSSEKCGYLGCLCVEQRSGDQYSSSCCLASIKFSCYKGNCDSCKVFWCFSCYKKHKKRG